MGEAQRAAELLARVKTSAEKRKLLIKRTISLTISFFLVIISVALVLYSTRPAGSMVPDFRGFLDELQDQYPIPLPLNTLIPTLINTGSPVIIKALVGFEAWDSPETDIRQKL